MPRREAWESYVRGRYFESWLNVDGVSKAIGHFGEATTRDPEWAEPHAGLVDAHVLLTFAGAVQPREAWDRAAECVERALERSPELAAAHAVGAWIALFRDWDWDAAHGRLRRALAREPDSHVIRLLYGVFLDLAGDAAAARRELDDALQADPLSGLAAVAQAFFHDPEGTPGGGSLPPAGVSSCGPTAPSVTGGSPSPAWPPVNPVGRSRRCARAVELSDDGIVMRAQLGGALARAGHYDETRALLSELEGLEGSACVSRYHLAVLRLALGERDRRRRTSSSVRPPTATPGSSSSKRDAALLELHGEPRFDRWWHGSMGEAESRAEGGEPAPRAGGAG